MARKREVLDDEESEQASAGVGTIYQLTEKPEPRRKAKKKRQIGFVHFEDKDDG